MKITHYYYDWTTGTQYKDTVNERDFGDFMKNHYGWLGGVGERIKRNLSDMVNGFAIKVVNDTFYIEDEE